MEYVVLWLIGGALGFYLTQLWWRRYPDFQRSDFVFFGVVCLLIGPLSIPVALICMLTTCKPKKDPVVWERRK